MSSIVAMKEERGTGQPAFGQVAREHQGMMLVYARTLLGDETRAREVVQEALVSAWKGMERFDVTRDVGAWLRGIVRNKWKDVCRRDGRKLEFGDEDLEYLESRMAVFVARPAVFDDLADCREKLPEEMGEVVQLSYDDGMKSEAVAEKLGIAAATVRKRLERARGLLRDCLEGIRG
ncbi:RNA polymerase sigma factor [Roseibacillus persicicus]